MCVCLCVSACVYSTIPGNGIPLFVNGIRLATMKVRFVSASDVHSFRTTFLVFPLEALVVMYSSRVSIFIVANYISKYSYYAIVC